MRITKVTPAHFEYIDTDDGEYRRYDDGEWETLMGESWEPVHLSDELEAMYQSFISEQEVVV